MAKKKKKIDTIKVEGLSSKTIEEFAPKDNSENEDKLWEEYFRGTPNVLDFPKKEQSHSLPPKETEKEETTAVTAATDVTTAAIATTVDTHTVVDKSATVGKGVKQEKEYTTLDSTHTKSEQVIYSIMYRETITKGKSQEYFSIRKLMKSTGIGSDKTVYKALQGLIAKSSIWMVEHSNNKPRGTLYRVHNPRDIFKLREERGIIVDINTKRIVNTVVTTATTVAKDMTHTKVKNKPKKKTE